MSYFFLLMIFVYKIIALWRAFQMFWYHTSPTLSLTLQLKPWKHCSPSNNILFRCSCVVQVKGVTRSMGFDVQVNVDTNLCSVGYKNVTLNIFPSIPIGFWSPEQARCWRVVGTHQLVNYIWMSCSQGLMGYRLTCRKKMAVMSLNSCLPSGGCQLKPILHANISQMLSIDEIAEWIAACNFRFSFWMCGVNSFHWHEKLLYSLQLLQEFLSRQGGPSIVLSFHYYWLFHCQVLLHGSIDGSGSWHKIFSFT